MQIGWTLTMVQQFGSNLPIVWNLWLWYIFDCDPQNKELYIPHSHRESRRNRWFPGKISYIQLDRQPSYLLCCHRSIRYRSRITFGCVQLKFLPPGPDNEKWSSGNIVLINWRIIINTASRGPTGNMTMEQKQNWLSTNNGTK